MENYLKETWNKFMIVICFSALVILYKRCFSNIAKHNNRKTVRAKKIDYDKNIKKNK